MSIDAKLLISIISISVVLLGFVVKIAMKQQKQDDTMEANKKDIEALKSITASCDAHQTRIESALQQIKDVDKRLVSQSAFNIKTEKQVEVLIAEFEYIKSGMLEMKDDIKELLRLRRTEK